MSVVALQASKRRRRRRDRTEKKNPAGVDWAADQATQRRMIGYLGDGKVATDRLMEIGARLADVPFFLQAPCAGIGRGDEITRCRI